MRNRVAAVLLIWAGALPTTGLGLQTEMPKRKLVVNSHVAYENVLNDFMASLKLVRFENWGDVIVVQGGAPADSDPRVGKDGVTFVKTKLNNYDLHGFAMLHRHRQHPLVKADAYFYLHDSSKVGNCFPKVFNQIAPSPAEVITVENFTSNICVFGRKVIESYGNNFDTILTKDEGVALEAFSRVVKGVHPIGSFGNPLTKLRHRNFMGRYDWYHTGYPRTIFWYREWDIYKAIFMGKDGDVKRNVRNISKVWQNPNLREAWGGSPLPKYGEIWAKRCHRDWVREYFQ